MATVRLDARCAPPARRARAFPPATLGAAALAFGPLCLPFALARTRGVLVGVPLGLVAAALVLGASSLVLAGGGLR